MRLPYFLHRQSLRSRSFRSKLRFFFSKSNRSAFMPCDSCNWANQSAAGRKSTHKNGDKCGWNLVRYASKVDSWNPLTWETLFGLLKTATAASMPEIKQTGWVIYVSYASYCSMTSMSDWISETKCQFSVVIAFNDQGLVLKSHDLLTGIVNSTFLQSNCCNKTHHWPYCPDWIEFVKVII